MFYKPESTKKDTKMRHIEIFLILTESDMASTKDT